jgi:hypothetical protein
MCKYLLGLTNKCSKTSDVKKLAEGFEGRSEARG